MNVEKSKNLTEAYKNQYSSEKINAWRKLGAEQKALNIIEITKDSHFNKVLEVGAGDGSVLKALSLHNFAEKFYALEISESGLEKIRSQKIPNLKSAKLFDGYEIPFRNKFFDLVILTHVLEHVEHERVLLREINRITKKLVIEVPRDYRFNADKKFAHFMSYGHINIYTPTSLRFLLLTENFKTINQLTRLYNKNTYLYNCTGIVDTLKNKILYFLKIILTHTPFQYFNAKFINTITILAEVSEEHVKIM